MAQQKEKYLNGEFPRDPMRPYDLEDDPELWQRSPAKERDERFARDYEGLPTVVDQAAYSPRGTEGLVRHCG